MYVAPVRKDKAYDEHLENLVGKIRKHITEKNDDYIILVIGQTGGGKSTLALHMLEMVMGSERININQVALSKEELASSLKSISKMPKPRAIIYDEANVNKRDALSKWNKELLDLYFSCRGLNIFHIWCNPSLETIDKVFLQDRLRGILLVRGKQIDRPRMYYYFRKSEIMNIYKKYENLNIDTITKVRKKYAWFRGWFKDYDGVIKQAYIDKKDSRMQVKVDQFFDKYADEKLISRADFQKKFGVSEITIRNYMKELEVDVDYVTSLTGRYSFTQAGVEKLKALFEKKKNLYTAKTYFKKKNLEQVSTVSVVHSSDFNIKGDV